MTSMSHYLIIRKPDSLDLAAAASAMAAQDFEVWLQPEQGSDGTFSITARWQPDAMLHTDNPGAGLFTKPPAQTHVMRFANGPAAHSALQDIAQSLAEDGAEVPLPLERDSHIYLQELDTDQLPRSTLGMRYALLAELLATAARTREVLIYEPVGAMCIAPADAHQLMDWRDMLELLDDPLPIKAFAGIEDPDFHQDSAMETGSMQLTPARRQSGAPAWLWVLGTLASGAAMAAWLAWR